MPRSFLVKKVKLDDFSTGADLENVYRHRTDLSLRLHDKGRSGCLHTTSTNRCLVKQVKEEDEEEEEERFPNIKLRLRLKGGFTCCLLDGFPGCGCS